MSRALTWVGLVVLGLAYVAFRWIYYRRAVSRLPEITDEAFLLRFGNRFMAPPDRVLKARRKIAPAELVR